MTDRNLRLKLGLFVAVTLAGLAGLVVLFGGAPSLFSTHAKYAITFPEAPGVSTGTPVRKSGVRVGEVTGVDLDDETGLVKVNVLMRGNYLPRPSDEATITRGLLSGDTAVDFVPKTGADDGPAPKVDPYPPGTDIPGVAPINPRALLNEFSGVIPATQESLVRMSSSFQRFEATAPKAEKAFDEVAALARAGREVVPEFRQTNMRIQELIGAAAGGGGGGVGGPVCAHTNWGSLAVRGAAPPHDPMANPVTLKDAIRDLAELLRAVRPAADELNGLLRDNGPEFSRTVQSVRRTSDSLNDLLNPENRRVASATLKNIQAASEDLTKTIRLAAILLSGAEETLKQLNARLAQTESVFANIDKATRPIADNSEQIVKDVSAAVKDVAATARTVNAAAGDLAKVLADVRAAVQQGTRGDGTLQKVLGDPSLYNNLNDAAAQAARLIARAERVAADLQVFADKIARKPETIGLGGVVHPSTGLKDAPNAPLPSSTPLYPYAPAPVPSGPGPRVWPAATDPGTISPIAPLPRDGAGVPSFRPATRATEDRPTDLPPR